MSDSAAVTCYSLAHARRPAHIRLRRAVCLHFGSDGRGGRIVAMSGDARIAAAAPPADQDVKSVAKYGTFMREGHGWSPTDFAHRYPIAIRVRPRGVRGHA